MRSSTPDAPKKPWLSVYELVVFALLGALMFATKWLMQLLPNIHLLDLFIVTFTVVYRKKALIPLYLYIALDGLFAGFALWWFPYLYIWTVLWGAVMLLPKNMKKPVACVVYPLVCGLHGLLFGTLYAPAQALMFHLDFEQMLAWIVSGLPFDLIHGISNLIVGLLIVPLVALLKRIENCKTAGR